MRRPAPTVIGRDRERAALRAFLEARDGPAALVLEGPAGIGKTTLLQAALRDTEGSTILRCRPARDEAQLAFSGIADLLAGDLVDAALPTLPRPQRHALEAALLRVDADAPPDIRAIAGGLQGVLRHAAAQAPVIVAIDDVQWLDPPSRTVVEFLARRTTGAQIVLLVARRTGADDALPLGLAPERVTRVTLRPMGLGALHQLLRERLFLTLPRPALRRLHATAEGNPFHALEIGLALQRRRVSLTEETLPIPAQLVDSRLRTLPAPVLALLQTVELLYDRRVDAVLRVPGGEHLDAAIEAGILEVADGRVAFTHGLLASAVQGLTGPARRSGLHAELAGIERSGEARALHLALCTTDPDAAVATELEDAALFAARRGAAETGGRLAEHAARLTPAGDHARLAHRVVLAADLHTTAGDLPRARALLAAAVEALPAGAHRARALSLLAWLRPDDGELAAAIALGEQAIAEAGDDAHVLATTHQRLGALERIRNRLDESLRHSELAIAGARSVGDDGLLALALASLGETRLILGAGVGPELRQAVEIEQRLPQFLGQQSPSRRLGLALLAVDAPGEARALFEDLYERADAAGHEDARAKALSHLVELERRAGNWARARELAETAGDLAQQVNTEQERNAIVGSEALLLAGLGETDRARRLALAGLETATRLGDGIFFLHYRAVLGFIDLSLEDFEAAAAWLAAATDALLALGVVELGLMPDVIHNEIEARLALGERDRAAALIAHLEALAERTGGAWIRAVAGRCRALLLALDGDVTAARAQVAVALAAHEEIDQPFELARTLIVAGALERRAKQRRAGRAALERAVALLDALPAPLWAARARAELARLGQQPAPGALTVTEARIAELAAAGWSNPEIAAAVFVSRKTVEANLSRVYRKLGVRSRVDLARRLSG